MGLVIFAAIGLYLLISIAVVCGMVRTARKNGRNAKLLGWSAALVMYLIPFWDWLPTVATHQYYCATEAGFWVYKTPEQWNKENPGVMETLTTEQVPPHQFEGTKNNLISTTFWNSRIKSIHKFNGPIFLHGWRREDELIDIKTNETLALYVDYSTSHERRQAGWTGWKMWLANDNCIGGRDKAIRLVKLVEQFKGNEK
jgi:hypothetical protein